MSDNVYTKALDARIAHEINANAASKRFLNNAKEYVSRDFIAAFLVESNVSAFFNDQENATKKVCMKMINRSIDYLQHAIDKSHHFSRKTRDYCVLETMINCHKNKVNMTIADARASCTTANDKRYRATEKHEKLVSHCVNMIDAIERQCSMSILALLNMRIIEKVSATEYKFADTKIAKAIIAKYK